MTTTYAERRDIMRLAIWGPFWPDSEARAIRDENREYDMSTCWNCISAYYPVDVTDADGRLHRLGRGRYFCSRACALEYRNAAFTVEVDGGELVLDSRRLREFVA